VAILGVEYETWYLCYEENRISSVGIATSYGLDGRSSIPGKGDFSLLNSVQTGSGAHPTSYPVGTGGSFPRDKGARE
jgi:hypothetical protein